MAQEPGGAAVGLRGDSGQSVNWLLKTVVGLALVGLLAFEVVAAVLVRATAADTASKASQEAGFVYRDTSDARRAEATAQEYVEKEGAEFVSLSVDTQSRSTTVTVRKKAKSLLIHKFHVFDKYTTVTETQSAPFPT